MFEIHWEETNVGTIEPLVNNRTSRGIESFK